MPGCATNTAATQMTQKPKKPARPPPEGGGSAADDWDDALLDAWQNIVLCRDGEIPADRCLAMAGVGMTRRWGERLDSGRMPLRLP